jgi:hypothetical protein
MFCNTTFTHSHILQLGLTKTFLAGPFARHQEDILFAQELAMLPAAQTAVAHDRLLHNIHLQLRDVYTNIKQLNALKHNLLYTKNHLLRLAHQYLFFVYLLYIIAIKIMITRTRRRKRQRQRRSRRFAFDPACWGKNKPLEQLWHDLSHFLSVVIVYKGTKPYEIISPVSAEQLRALNADPRVVAILTSHPDVHNAYETLVYPRAKDKTVDYVITHYDKIFKRVPARVHPIFKDASHMTMHKLRAPTHTKYT